MPDDVHQKIKVVPHKLRRVVMIVIGIVLSGSILWYFLYGSCGYVSVKSSIENMNTILDGWQELRHTTIPAFSLDGAVPYETIAIMEEWKRYAYELQVPSCLRSARSTLIDAIESDYQTFHLAKDRITIDKKLEFLSSNDALFVRYQQNVVSIEACAPRCSIDTDLHNLLEVLHKMIRGED